MNKFDFWLRNGVVSTFRDSVLAGRPIAELVVMKETRRLLDRIFKSKSLAIDPALRQQYEAATADRKRHAAPFMPLGPAQRLGYLDEATHLTCTVPLDGFRDGHRYRVNCRTVPTHKIEGRPRLSGGTEEVQITGTDLLITIGDDKGRTHVFCMHATPDNKRIYKSHSLLRLTQHFEIPPAPDIAQMFPERYRALRKRLEAFTKPC